MEERPSHVRWLNSGEVAIRLGVTPKRVDFLLRAGKIKSIKVTNRRRIREDWLLAYQDELRENERAASHS